MGPSHYLGHCLMKYIWCISKLGIIFRSPMGKQIFLMRPIGKKYAVLHPKKRCSFQIKEQSTQKYIGFHIFHRCKVPKWHPKLANFHLMHFKHFENLDTVCVGRVAMCFHLFLAVPGLPLQQGPWRLVVQEQWQCVSTCSWFCD